MEQWFLHLKASCMLPTYRPQKREGAVDTSLSQYLEFVATADWNSTPPVLVASAAASKTGSPSLRPLPSYESDDSELEAAGSSSRRVGFDDSRDGKAASRRLGRSPVSDDGTGVGLSKRSNSEHVSRKHRSKDTKPMTPQRSRTYSKYDSPDVVDFTRSYPHESRPVHVPAVSHGSIGFEMVLSRRPALPADYVSLYKWQRNRCAQCRAELPASQLAMPTRYCNYTEMLFCRACMAPDVAVGVELFVLGVVDFG
jgi:hypothetical protein